jgi:hypothetical protein
MRKINPLLPRLYTPGGPKYLLLLLCLWAGSAAAQMKVVGKGLYDPNGERIIARGVENSFGIALSEDGRFIDEIAKTGANAIRILPNLSPNQLTLAQVENLIAKAKGYGMIVYISPAPPIPAGSSKDEECWKWFERDDVYAMLGKYRDFIIIDGVQEHTAPDANVWAASCKTAIDRLRRKGYTVPLLMMSNDYGRNHETIINKAAEIFNYDPLKNTFFNVQAYWDQNWSGVKKYSTELILERIPQLAALNYCVQIGITPWAEGAPCDNGFVDYKTAMAECQKYNLGWLVWDWHNPYEWSHVFSVTTSGIYGEWNNHCTYAPVDDCRDGAKYGCDYGYQVCIGHVNSIQKTAVKTCFMRGNVNCGGTTPLRTPENPTNTVAGVDYRYYEGTWSVLPNFDALAAAKTGTVANFDLTPRNRNDNFGFKYTGYVNVPTDGTYTFYTSSDDGSKLYIGTTEVVNNDGAHASQERSGTIGLRAGKHAISVTFFEATGGEVLTVSYAGPGITKQVIPNTALYRAGGTTTPPSGQLLAYEGFSTTTGALHGSNTGTGWGGAWQVQNNDVSVPGYNVTGTGSLGYATLSATGLLAVGGDSYQTAGRALNTGSTGPFSTYLTGGNIGLAGKTLWISALLRKDGANDDEVSLTLHASNLVTLPEPALVQVGYFGAPSNNAGVRYWSLKVGTTVYRTSTAIATSQPALLVLKLVFGSPNTISLYANPGTLGGSGPATAGAQATSTTSIAFRQVAWYGGGGFNQSALDEIRFGDSYSAVTPPGGSARAVAPTPELTAEAVKVYPNPGREQIFLQMNAPQAAKARVEVRSLAGQLLRDAPATLQLGLNTLAAPVKGLPAGTYVLVISANGQRLTKKLVVQP